MKHLIPAAIFSAAFITGSACAQSDVSVYGVFDTMIRSSDNEINPDGSRGNRIGMEQGVLQGSRLGFKGTEQIDDATSAVFALEMGFLSNNGSSDQQGQLFGRQAYVGLKNTTWGELDVGRQYGVAFDLLGNYDPLGMGNLPENAWQLFLVGVRFDHTLKYTNSWGPLKAEVQYSPGGQTDSDLLGSTSGLGLIYSEKPLSVGVFVQRSVDANARAATMAGLGGAWQFDATTVFLNYFRAQRDSGFSTDSHGGALANTSLLSNAANTLRRTDDVTTIGLNYQATSATNYMLGYMTDSVKNESSLGNDGKISTAYALVDYSLSKNTDMYFSLDYTILSGGEIDQGALTNTVLQFADSGMGGASNRLGVVFGVRLRF